MATNDNLPKRQVTPIPVPMLPMPSVPQKRTLEDDHAPPISSPLNPNPIPASSSSSSLNPNPQPHDDAVTMGARDKPTRIKKETLKKRESKLGVGANAAASAGGPGTGTDSSRATPDPKTKDPVPSESFPLRYKLAPPKPADFDPARGPVFTLRNHVSAPDGSRIQFFETSEQ